MANGEVSMGSPSRMIKMRAKHANVVAEWGVAEAGHAEALDNPQLLYLQANCASLSLRMRVHKRTARVSHEEKLENRARHHRASDSHPPWWRQIKSGAAGVEGRRSKASALALGALKPCLSGTPSHAVSLGREWPPKEKSCPSSCTYAPIQAAEFKTLR